MSRKRNRLALPVGYRLGRYLLGDQLGAGTFGITYLADDTELNRQVAIKELLPRDIVSRDEDGEVVAIQEADDEQWEWAKDRFMKEASTIAACTHPNILQVYQTFRASGTVYMVTRYEEGKVLKQWLDDLGRAPSEAELRRILLPMLSALERVHGRGFLHRDIQPQNVYLTDENGPVLIDFGSARQVVNRRSQPVTSIVCEGYAPFEQYSDTGMQGAWTDLYGLAAVMYRCVTGQKPPNAPDRALLQGNDPCLRLANTHAAHYSREFLQAIDKALAVDADRRFRTAAEWRTALGARPMQSGNSEEFYEEYTTQERPTMHSAPRDDYAPPTMPLPQEMRFPAPTPAAPAPPPMPRSLPLPEVPTQGADVHYNLVLSSGEAAMGVEKIVAFERQMACSACQGLGRSLSRSGTNTCSSCLGRGQVPRRCQVRVRLPAGMRRSSTLSSSGQGHAGLQGGAPGALHVHVQIEGLPQVRAVPDWVPPAAAPQGRFGAAFISFLVPGIGSVPRTAVFPSMLFLLTTALLYLIGFRLWDCGNSTGTALLVAAGLLHLGAVIAAWRTGTVQESTRFFSNTGGGWLATFILLALVVGAVFALQMDVSIPSLQEVFGAAEQTEARAGDRDA